MPLLQLAKNSSACSAESNKVASFQGAFWLDHFMLFFLWRRWAVRKRATASTAADSSINLNDRNLEGGEETLWGVERWGVVAVLPRSLSFPSLFLSRFLWLGGRGCLSRPSDVALGFFVVGFFVVGFFAGFFVVWLLVCWSCIRASFLRNEEDCRLDNPGVASWPQFVPQDEKAVAAVAFAADELAHGLQHILAVVAAATRDIICSATVSRRASNEGPQDGGRRVRVAPCPACPALPRLVSIRSPRLYTLRPTGYDAALCYTFGFC